MEKHVYTTTSRLDSNQKNLIIRSLEDVRFATEYVEPLIRESDDEALIDTVPLIQQEVSDLINFIKSDVELTGPALIMLNNSLIMLKKDFGKIRSYLYKIHSKHAEGCMFRDANLNDAFSLDRSC